LFEPKATRKELHDANQTFAKTAIALSTLFGQISAVLATRAGVDLGSLEADFRAVAGKEDLGEVHSMLVEVLAKQLQIEAKEAEFQRLRGATEELAKGLR